MDLDAAFEVPAQGAIALPLGFGMGSTMSGVAWSGGTGKTSGRAQNRLKTAHQFAAAGTPIPQAPEN